MPSEVINCRRANDSIGRCLLYTSREGVKFHDGTPFNADAVVKQYTRMIDPDINLGAYSLWEPIEKIEKVSDYEVKIVTKTRCV